MTTPERIRRRQQIGNTLEALTLLVVIAVFGYQLLIVNPQNASTHSALCLFRTDLQDRVEQTQHFIQHPNTAPDFNDPKTIDLIRSQLEGQKRTLDALSDLTCD